METSSAHIKRIREAFPNLLISSVRANHAGLVNDVLIVNEALVFRFPKNDTWAKALLDQELRVMEVLRHYIDMPIPVFEYRTEDFVVYKYIPGRTLHRNDLLRLADTAQDHLAAQLATFLRQMHTIPREALAQQQIAPSDVNRSHEVWCRLFEDVQRELFPLMMAHTQAWVSQHFEPVLKDPHWMDYSPVLINGDVGPYHILYDPEQRQINGLIDFGTAGLGDPAADFACMIVYYGETFLRRMDKFYPEIRHSVDRARFWAGTLELQWALRGMRSQDTSWFMVHIGGARDVLPVGSAWA